MRTLAMGLAVVMGGVAMARAQDIIKVDGKVNPSRSARAAGIVPDPSWEPEPGDRATVVVANTPACANLACYAEFVKFAAAQDPVGMEGYLKRGLVMKLARGTTVLVLKRYKTEAPTVIRPISPGGVPEGPPAVVLESSVSEGDTPLEVRILDGELKGQVRFVPERFVAEIIAASPTKKAAKPKPTADLKPVTPEGRATSLLLAGKDLEKAGKIEGALDHYRKVVEEYPGTSYAGTAAERIEALDPK